MTSSANRLGGRRISLWTLPVSAAAIVAVVILALFLPNHGRHSSALSASNEPGTFVTLRARTDDLSATDLKKAQRIISARAAALGAVDADVRIVGSDEITAFLPKLTASAVQDLGAVYALQLRPAIGYASPQSPGVPETTPSSGGVHRVVNPWKSLGFAPPKDSKAFYALSLGQQRAIADVLGHWDCNDRSPDQAEVPIVACDPLGEYRSVLGPVIVASNQIDSVAPAANPDAIAYDWQIAVTLSPAGDQRFTDFLTRFTEWGRTLHPGKAPYGSYPAVVDVLDGVALAGYQVKKPITDSTFGASGSTGSFDQRTAIRLAAYLNAGPLPAPFDVVSIRSR